MKENRFKQYEDLPLTLTVPEVGEALGISRAAAYALVRSEGFPHLRIGNRILVPKDSLSRGSTSKAARQNTPCEAPGGVVSAFREWLISMHHRSYP